MLSKKIEEIIRFYEELRTEVTWYERYESKWVGTHPDKDRERGKQAVSNLKSITSKALPSIENDVDYLELKKKLSKMSIGSK